MLPTVVLEKDPIYPDELAPLKSTQKRHPIDSTDNTIQRELFFLQ